MNGIKYMAKVYAHICPCLIRGILLNYKVCDLVAIFATWQSCRVCSTVWFLAYAGSVLTRAFHTSEQLRSLQQDNYLQSKPGAAAY